MKPKRYVVHSMLVGVNDVSEASKDQPVSLSRPSLLGDRFGRLSAWAGILSRFGSELPRSLVYCRLSFANLSAWGAEEHGDGKLFVARLENPRRKIMCRGDSGH